MISSPISKQRLIGTTAPPATLLIRVLVGGVFLSEGLQKFIFPTELGAGRFAVIGIPYPQAMGPFVGICEIVCGLLLILGLLTRLAAAIMLINISVAILSTKVPILLGHPIGPFSLQKLSRYGLWSFLHEARTDLSMWIGSLFLIIVGAGPRSLDGLLSNWTPKAKLRS
jgi:putative oxidoreductase